MSILANLLGIGEKKETQVSQPIRKKNQLQAQIDTAHQIFGQIPKMIEAAKMGKYNTIDVDQKENARIQEVFSRAEYRSHTHLQISGLVITNPNVVFDSKTDADL